MIDWWNWSFDRWTGGFPSAWRPAKSPQRKLWPVSGHLGPKRHAFTLWGYVAGDERHGAKVVWSKFLSGSVLLCVQHAGSHLKRQDLFPALATYNSNLRFWRTQGFEASPHVLKAAATKCYWTTTAEDQRHQKHISLAWNNNFQMSKKRTK